MPCEKIDDNNVRRQDSDGASAVHFQAPDIMSASSHRSEESECLALG